VASDTPRSPGTDKGAERELGRLERRAIPTAGTGAAGLAWVPRRARAVVAGAIEACAPHAEARRWELVRGWRDRGVGHWSRERQDHRDLSRVGDRVDASGLDAREVVGEGLCDRAIKPGWAAGAVASWGSDSHGEGAEHSRKDHD